MNIKKQLPLFFLIISGLIFSYNFTERYDLAIHDEALYARAYYRFHNGWAPLYQLLYGALNYVTSSPPLSSDVINFTLSFFLIPLTIFFFTGKIGFSRPVSAIMGFLSLIATWNFPSSPKVQTFNLVLILLIMLIRWQEKISENKRLFFFYGLMTISIYSRQDNIILLLVFASYDIFRFWKGKNHKSLLIICSSIVVAYSLAFAMLGPSSTSNRTWLAFRDHFDWRNEKALALILPGKSHYAEELDVLFKGKKTILEAYLVQSDLVNVHFAQNIKELPDAIELNAKVLLDLNGWIIAFFILGIGIIQMRPLTIDIRSQRFQEFVIFSSTLILKCLITSILLQPWDKYTFEINIVLMIATAYILNIIFSTETRKEQYLYLLLPLMLFFGNYQALVSPEVLSIRKMVKVLEQENSKKTINTIISNFGFSAWFPGPHYLIPHNERKSYELIKRNLAEYLERKKVDVIIFDSDMRGLLSKDGISEPFENFEKNPSNYNFTLVKGVAFQGIAFYRRNSSGESP